MGYANYADAVQRGSIVPKDEFQHKKYVLESEPELVREFHKLVDAQLKLANLEDKQELTLVQYQIFNLFDLFSMSLKEPKLLTPVFQYCYYCWKGGLAMTRAKKGRERGLQALVGASSPESEGFGLISQGDEEEGKFFEKLAGYRPKFKQNAFAGND